MEDFKPFSQWGSKTPGHPEYGHTAGVDATTGPLGQGHVDGGRYGDGGAFLAATFNRRAR